MSKSSEWLESLLTGHDLRSIGKVNEIIALVRNQGDFDELFSFMAHTDRLIRMRAADAVEKISLEHPEYLQGHVAELFELCKTAVDKEFRWHLALLLSRPVLSKTETDRAWAILMEWARDKTNSRITRVNAMEGLYRLCRKEGQRLPRFQKLLDRLVYENIPSINARIRKIQSRLEK